MNKKPTLDSEQKTNYFLQNLNSSSNELDNIKQIIISNSATLLVPLSSTLPEQPLSKTFYECHIVLFSEIDTSFKTANGCLGEVSVSSQKKEHEISFKIQKPPIKNHSKFHFVGSGDFSDLYQREILFQNETVENQKKKKKKRKKSSNFSSPISLENGSIELSSHSKKIQVILISEPLLYPNCDWCKSKKKKNKKNKKKKKKTNKNSNETKKNSNVTKNEKENFKKNNQTDLCKEVTNETKNENKIILNPKNKNKTNNNKTNNNKRALMKKSKSLPQFNESKSSQNQNFKTKIKLKFLKNHPLKKEKSNALNEDENKNENAKLNKKDKNNDKHKSENLELDNSKSPNKQDQENNEPIINNKFLFKAKFSKIIQKINQFIQDFANNCKELQKAGTIFQYFIQDITNEYVNNEYFQQFTQQLNEEEAITQVSEFLEQFLLNILNDKVIDLIKKSWKEDKDVILKYKLEDLKFIEFHHLEIDKKIMDQNSIEKAQKKLRKIDLAKYPKKKLEYIKKFSNLLSKMISKNKITGADDLLPVIIYVLLFAKVPNLKLNLDYISNFRDYNKIAMSEEGYHFANILSAVSFLENLKPENVGLDPLGGLEGGFNNKIKVKEIKIPKNLASQNHIIFSNPKKKRKRRKKRKRNLKKNENTSKVLNVNENNEINDNNDDDNNNDDDDNNYKNKILKHDINNHQKVSSDPFSEDINDLTKITNTKNNVINLTNIDIFSPNQTLVNTIKNTDTSRNDRPDEIKLLNSHQNIQPNQLNNEKNINNDFKTKKFEYENTFEKNTLKEDINQDLKTNTNIITNTNKNKNIKKESCVNLESQVNINENQNFNLQEFKNYDFGKYVNIETNDLTLPQIFEMFKMYKPLFYLYQNFTNNNLN
ncbi:rab5 gdp/gtp exchange factor [Anaeramoeba flamelloides]|uniref:Rab5 gdp/gtp exchange factor n=1 Tax=Anaeramoeba flamelloides TaxID=1746091 RepID=A0AAV7Z4I8_9EUKA|nr:rab5 gdp/gtp exchange factor [Anaeramoeba flamelloides]